MNLGEVKLRRARLVLGWVTVSGVQLPMWENLSQYMYKQSPKSTQPGHLSVDRRNEYQRLGSKGRYGSSVGGV